MSADCNAKNNDDNNRDNNEKNIEDNTNISIKRSTFTKIIIIGVISLMFASFFAGFSLHNIHLLMTPSGTTPIVVPSALCTWRPTDG